MRCGSNMFRSGRGFMMVIVAALAVVSPACQPKQEEAEPKKSPRVEAESSQPGLLELSEKSQALAQIQTDQAAVRPLRLALKAQGGKILPNENRLAHLGVRVPGRILAVYANLGDRVKADDPLLKLDSPAVGEALLEYRKRRTAVRMAEKALERARLLFEEGAVGAAEYQRREAELDNAKADLDEAEEKLHLLGMTEREIERFTAESDRLRAMTFEAARTDAVLLFSETASRHLVTVRPENRDAFESAMDGNCFSSIGVVTEEGMVSITGLSGQAVVTAGIDELKEAWQKPLRDM